ncbi:MAG: hypothetical protein LBN24_04080 [Mediterranea sp.]|jgi:hypothetical protein|nr:hypothetical protein [Mediterranea sp.]
MKQLIVLCGLLCCAITFTHAQRTLQSGIMIEGGVGHTSAQYFYSFPLNDIDYKASVAVGYQFRIRPILSKHFFIDVNPMIGVRFQSSKYAYSDVDYYNGWGFLHTGGRTFYHLSLGGMANCSLWKGLNIGVGVEPTYVFAQEEKETNLKFHLPLVGKLGYDFGPVEVAVKYKHGLTNAIKNSFVKSGKFREWQLSLFVPLFR